jgi:hypothetical protein
MQFNESCAHFSSKSSIWGKENSVAHFAKMLYENKSILLFQGEERDMDHRLHRRYIRWNASRDADFEDRSQVMFAELSSPNAITTILMSFLSDYVWLPVSPH